MRDEHRAALLQACAVDLHLRVLHGDARQSLQARIVNRKREERRDGWFDRVAEGRRPVIAVPITPGGQQDPIGGQRLAGSRSHHKPRSIRALDRVDRDGRANLDTGVLRGFDQAFDNRRRSIGGGEDAAIGLGLEGHAVPRKPLDRVTRLKARERAAQRCAATRIVLHQHGGIETGVGDVAAPAAGDANFGEQGGRLFQNDDVLVRILFRAGNRRKEPGRAAADDNEL